MIDRSQRLPRGWRKIAAERRQRLIAGDRGPLAQTLYREAQVRGALLALPGRPVITVIDLPTLLWALRALSVGDTHWPPPGAQ